MLVLCIVLPLWSSDLNSQAIDSKTTNEDGFARYATSIWSARETSITSPDGRKAIVVRPPRVSTSDETHDVRVRVNGREFKTQIGAWVNAEVLWAPDSKAFLVTYSDGGGIGTFHVKVFYPTATGLHISEPVPNGRRLFAPWCFGTEYPNVGGIRWMGKDSTRLLIAIEVPPHSSCASMGTFRAFEIRLPDGKVLNRFGQIEAKKLFASDMGNWLSDSDDACVLKPEDCIPTGLKKR